MTSTVWFLPKAAEALTKSCPEILLSPPQPQLTTHVQGHLPASAQGGQAVQEKGGRSWGPPRAGREPGGTWGYKFKDTTNKTSRRQCHALSPKCRAFQSGPLGPGESTHTSVIIKSDISTYITVILFNAFLFSRACLCFHYFLRDVSSY